MDGTLGAVAGVIIARLFYRNIGCARNALSATGGLNILAAAAAGMWLSMLSPHQPPALDRAGKQAPALGRREIGIVSAFLRDFVFLP
jgi:hypothetical protein